MQVQVLRPLADRPQHSGMFKCACDTLQRNGLRGIYQGLSGTLLRNIPANCVYFGTNQQMRLWLASDSHSGEQLSSTQLLLAGGTAGLLYWLMTFPADVIKVCLCPISFLFYFSLLNSNPHRVRCNRMTRGPRNAASEGLWIVRPSCIERVA